MTQFKKFTSSKVFDGFSTCFRQWKAQDTHCMYLHGYAISFEVFFEGELDERNFVWDFGGMKRAKTKIEGMSPSEYFTWLFDHTTIIAQDDPRIAEFQVLQGIGVIQLRTIPATGCERFAEFLFDKINQFLCVETQGRVRATKVTVKENNKNSASYGE